MTQSVDVLVVGSGPVGSAYARLILDARPETTVMMVELGPKISAQAGVNVANLSPQERADAQSASSGPWRNHAPTTRGTPSPTGNSGQPGLHPVDAGGLPAAAMASCVGGMGAYWLCATPRPYGSEVIPFLDPVEWAEALATAERLLGTTHDLFASAPGGQTIRASLDTVLGPALPSDRRAGVLPVAASPRAGDVRWSGTDTILGDTPRAGDSQPGGLDLRPETICRSLVTEAGRVTGATLEYLPGHRREHVDPKAVVVAADSLRTPQLLWASGIRPLALGKYLNEHTMMTASVELDPQTVPRLSEEEARRDVVSVSHVPFAESSHPFHGQVVQTAGSALSSGTAEAGLAVLTWFGRKRPHPRDRVSFSDRDTDRCGMPAMRIDYRLTSVERDELRAGVQAVRQCAAALGPYRQEGEATVLPEGSSLHYQGTVRMGKRDDDTSVCDRYSRVWGYRNLFLGGNGVIPTATACNPTLTSVALAVLATPRLVEILE